MNPGDGVLVFSPYFPTYVPNIERRGARAVLTPLKQANGFRPTVADIERFLEDDPSPRAIFLNSPHNPTGGVTTEDDLKRIADIVRGRDVAVFSDEPYCHMVWSGSHHSILSQPGMLAQCVGAYTFSKSYSMSGWRLGFAVASAEVADAIGKMINTTLSCTPPIVQLAGTAALKRDKKERDEVMLKFREKVVLLTEGLNRIDGFRALDPTATFYVFPNVAPSLQQAGHHEPRPRAVHAGRRRRQVRRRVPGRRMLRRSRRRASCASAAPSRTSACGRRSTSSRRRLRAPTGSRPGSTRTRNTGWRSPTPSNRRTELRTRRPYSYVKPVTLFTGPSIFGADTIS